MSIELRGVTVDLPVYTASARSLRKSLTKATVGGSLFARADNKVVVRALNNVDLKVEDGDRVALIGPNGAGKTTLLRVMAGIYTPTSGMVNVTGSISSALNTGLGLDPELSGRENIFMIGYMRGLSRATIEAGLDDIMASADLGSFLELPVNTYSSGMAGRLVFSVATAFQPDVLLMDEWLLAGDANFMQKAQDRTRAFVKQARVVVLASHSLGIVRSFCNRAAYLRAGQLIAYGPTEEMLAIYDEDTRRGHHLTAVAAA